MNIKSNATIIISTAIALSLITLTSVTGLWATESTKIPKKLSIELVSKSSSEYDPADIKGSYTFSEISELYNIPIEILSTAFSVEKNEVSSFKCKDVKEKFSGSPDEIGTASVRLFVSFYNGLDYEPTEDIYLPESAVSILKKLSGMTQNQLSYLDTHTAILPY